MPGGCFPIVDPTLADFVRPLDQFAARFLSVLDHNDHPGVELLLGVVNIRQARSLVGDHILNRHLGSVGMEYRMAISVFARRA